MSKNNSLLNRIKAKIGAEKASPAADAPARAMSAAQEEQGVPLGLGKKGISSKQETLGIDRALQEGGFPQLIKLLEDIKEDMDFGRNAVYIDEETAEVLDLLRKKAKIKSNLLVSCLLHAFFQKHKELIQELLEKRSNRLLD